jgi:diguanylate cyclase (GGDEF)-like protein
MKKTDTGSEQADNGPAPSASRHPPGEEGELCHWSLLYDVTDLVGSKSFDYDLTAHSILETGAQIVGAERGFLMLFDKQRELLVKALYRMEGQAVERDPAIIRLIEETMRSNRPILREMDPAEGAGKASGKAGAKAGGKTGGKEGKAGKKPKKTGKRTVGARTASRLAIPLWAKLRERPPMSAERRRFPFKTLFKQIGVMILESAPGCAFGERDVRALEAFANHAADMIVNARLYQLVTVDPLTGFYTRKELEQNLIVEMTLAEHTNAPLALLMIDIDGFQEIRYAHGYLWCEKVIQKVARAIKQWLRDADSCFRYGGEQFTALLPNTDEKGARAIAEKIRSYIETELQIGRGISTTVSIGIAVFPYHADRKEDLIKKADQTLFMAKQAGGDRVHVWHRGISRYALRTDKLIGIITGDQAKDYRNVLMLLDTIVVVNSILERREMLSTIMDMMIELTNTERGILFRYGGGGRLEADWAQDHQKRRIDPRDYAEGVVDRVAGTGLPVCVVGYGGEEASELEDSLRDFDLKTVLCVPLMVKDRKVGILYFDSHTTPREFIESDLIFFQALSREIGIALENARLYEENRLALKEVEELNKKLAQKVERQAHELAEVKDVLEHSISELKLKYNYDKIVGKSPKMQEIYRLLDRITDTEVPVLLTGESGTGKELVAKAIHFNGPRKAKPFVSVNCAAISESLLESELFGHVRGAFTGADRDKKGLFEQAHGGTIFLDEVQDMSPGMQSELLRVLQEGEIRAVGGKEIKKIDVRVISATNQNLKQLMRSGQFREDLYYRLNVVNIHLPPIRERKEDIPLIVSRYLEDYSRSEGRQVKISKAATRQLLRHDWPGNVREIHNFLEKTILMFDGEVITERDVDFELEEKEGREGDFYHLPYKEAKEHYMAEYIKRALARNNGNVTRASEESGIVRSSFHKIMRKYDINAKDFYNVK